jgi:hypothetical protein
MLIKHMTFTLALVFASAALTSTASAQGRTRDEVRQELIQAENNGSRLVTDASYPDVSPIFEQQAAHERLMHGGSGPEMSGSSEVGNRTAITSSDPSTSKQECVGPAGFCKPYFGS